LAIIPAVEGDNHDYYDVTLQGALTMPPGTVVKAILTLAPFVEPVTLPMTVQDDANHVVRLTVSAGDLVHGAWSVDWQVTWADGTRLTWPVRGHDTIQVRRAIGLQ
jgi:hypothetical protein